MSGFVKVADADKVARERDRLNEGLRNFLELTLMFHSGVPWDEATSRRWNVLQTPIQKMLTLHDRAVATVGSNGWAEATTRGLCDLGRVLRREIARLEHDDQ